MSKNIRLRFAPSPTGPLHLGGVRTALFSYLYAKKHGGSFILRIEDTDQSRFVEGAEDYIWNSLIWSGLPPDESPRQGGDYGPYKQSQRKEIYHKYVDQLVKDGYAYYAFDTKEEIEEMRSVEEMKGNHNPMYGHHTRMRMKNSLTLSASETKHLMDTVPYVIRFLMPANEIITVYDMIRGEVSVNCNELDDKVLMKADGMPTYHLAVVVDDYLMKISHVFRGEEWLPSAPLHVLLWERLGWGEHMPQWAHLPLILKPDGKGKLSKRDGDRLGFPVFPLDWVDPVSQEKSIGFEERGFLPEGFDNMLLMLGWNPGNDREIYSLSEMVKEFDVKKIVKSGAKFDYQKAVWYNQQHIHALPPEIFTELCSKIFEKNQWLETDKYKSISQEIQSRCSLMTDVEVESRYFFIRPVTWVDLDTLASKWTAEQTLFFNRLIENYTAIDSFDRIIFESTFKALMNEMELKPGMVMMPYRVALVGDKKGPDIFAISSILGKQEVITRLENFITNFT